MMRESVYLNGEWDFMPDYQGRSMESLVEHPEWGDAKIRVPSTWRFTLDPESDYQPFDVIDYPWEWNEAQSGLLGRSFAATRRPGERIFLIFEAVLQKSAVFVNGHKVLESQEGFLPLEMDITDYVHDGEDNDLKVWCGPFDSTEIETGRKELAPNGSWFTRMARGVWQDAYLEYRPALFIDDVFVRTSTRRGDIQVDVEVRNTAGARSGRVRQTIFDGDDRVKELKSEIIDFGAGETVAVSLQAPWPDALHWSPEHPHLYTLKTEILAGEEVIDSVDARFGFREVWIDGRDFYLNGMRLNLRVDACHYQGFIHQTPEYARNWYRTAQETNINCIRLHAMPYPRFYLDVADEMGMLIVDESAIYGSSKTTLADHPFFLENCRSHLRSLVKRDRNHPSIIIWSMQNEMRWVDGREGYKAAMPELTQIMRDLDPTRPISYDGDNRLVEPDQMEIVSMHYNIDGSVQSWKKDKPLIFGEHGKWHYVCPQACVGMAGPEAYLDYHLCLDVIGEHEARFIEYARREDVTGHCPFNMGSYMLHMQPPEETLLSWDAFTGPGVKMDRINPYTLTIHNGLIEGPLYIPNPSWAHVRDAFKPAAIFANEYDALFFDDSVLTRSFSVYNDTEHPASVRLSFRWEDEAGTELAAGEDHMLQPPGERWTWETSLPLPPADEVRRITLHLLLHHDDALVHTLEKAYVIYPQTLKTTPIDARGRRVALLGDESSHQALHHLIPDILWLGAGEGAELNDVDFLIIGKDFAGRVADWQPRLRDFVEQGGFLLILEQGGFLPGELTLSGQKFYAAYPSEPDHPVFNGLDREDLRFWGAENIHEGEDEFLVQNAFVRPEQGDVRALLECGKGDFGYGGMQWAALLEYREGAGGVLVNQVAILSNFDRRPQAVRLLRNMLDYGVHFQAQSRFRAGLLADSNSPARDFCDAIDLAYDLVTDDFAAYPLLLLDPDELAPTRIAALQDYVRDGGRLLVLPSEPEHTIALQALLKTDVDIIPADVYQLKPQPHPLNAGLSLHDLFHIERAAYAKTAHQNTVICNHALDIRAAQPLWENVQAPWEALFVQRQNQEYRQVAVAEAVDSSFEPRCYGAIQKLGEGEIIFSQMRLLADNAKVRRAYARLLSNLGAEIDTQLLSHLKDSLEYGIPAMMALPHEPYQDYERMEAYFTDPNYILNNLGEGVFGWMKPIHQQDGWLHAPDSAGKAWFLTVFVESKVNRDPAQRVSGELPDPSIVPDMEVSTNSAFKMFINGLLHFEYANPDDAPVDLFIEDAILRQGINRLVFVCYTHEDDILLNARFKSKFGDYLTDLVYHLTLD